MSKTGYAAVGLGFVLAGLKSGMFSGSMTKDRHSGRVRINFNLNKSKFYGPASDRFYQYSIYGNQQAIDHSSVLRDLQEEKGDVLISEFGYGKRTNFSEASFLKDVTVWCDTVRMSKFHNALEEAMSSASNLGLSFALDRKAYLDHVSAFMEGELPHQRDSQGRARPPVVKTPFCFLEGKLLSHKEFINDMSKDGFSIDSPAGIAKFNPRDANSQPPGFLFSAVSDVNSDPPSISELPFLVGAKYAALINSVATPFAPVYLWGPCVCDQSYVWDSSTKELNAKFPGMIKKSRGKNLYVNTYELYFNRLGKCSKEMTGYGYIEILKELPEEYRIRKQSMDEFIAASQYPMDLKGSMGKKSNKRKKNVRRKPVRKKSKSPNQVPESVIRDRIANRAMEIFNKNYVSDGSDPAGTCVNLALCGMLAGKEFGRDLVIVGGSCQWKFIPDHLDDGISANFFGYVYEPNSFNSNNSF